MDDVIEIKRFAVIAWQSPSGCKVVWSQEIKSWVWIDHVGNYFGLEPREAVERIRRIKEVANL